MAQGTPQPPRGTRPAPGRSQPVRGDATGAKRVELQREHEAELRERESNLTTIANERTRSITDDVVDITNPERPTIAETGRPVDPEQEAREAEPEQTLISGPGKPEVYVLNEPEPLPNARREVLRRDPQWLNELVVFRVNCDLPDVTIGVGNNYSFEEGRRYKAPRYVQLHLEEKGLCWH